MSKDEIEKIILMTSKEELINLQRGINDPEMHELKKAIESLLKKIDR